MQSRLTIAIAADDSSDDENTNHYTAVPTPKVVAPLNTTNE
jgi:hypothetical protein